VEAIVPIAEEGSEDSRSQRSRKMEPSSLQPKNNFEALTVNDLEDKDPYAMSRSLLED